MIDLNLIQLPEGVSWYEVGGATVFPLYDNSGGILATQVSWLIKRDGEKYLASFVLVNLNDDRAAVEKKIKQASLLFVEFNPNGGRLPMTEKQSSG